MCIDAKGPYPATGSTAFALENGALKQRIATLEQQLAEADKALEMLREIERVEDRVMAMTDEQIAATCRIEGHDTGDLVIISRLTIQLAKLRGKVLNWSCLWQDVLDGELSVSNAEYSIEEMRQAVNEPESTGKE